MTILKKRVNHYKGLGFVECWFTRLNTTIGLSNHGSKLWTESQKSIRPSKQDALEDASFRIKEILEVSKNLQDKVIII